MWTLGREGREMSPDKRPLKVRLGGGDMKLTEGQYTLIKEEKYNVCGVHCVSGRNTVTAHQKT